MPTCYETGFEKVIWRTTVQAATGLTPYRSVTHMLWNWLQNFNTQKAINILTGAVTMCWAIWCCRNDSIFDNVKHSSFMQAIFRGTYWCDFWCDFGQYCSVRRRQRSYSWREHFFEDGNLRTVWELWMKI
jgi:hypothetical protein